MLLISVAALIFSSKAWALQNPANQVLDAKESITMTLSPQQCVALHEGQQCFAEISISWASPIAKNYCLYSSQSAKPITCWNNSDQGAVEYNLETSKNVQFIMMQVLTNQPNKLVAESELQVSWVYKKKQKSRLSWRLF